VSCSNDFGFGVLWSLISRIKKWYVYRAEVENCDIHMEKLRNSGRGCKLWIMYPIPIGNVSLQDVSSSKKTYDHK
jgi:hypothetical protein